MSEENGEQGGPAGEEAAGPEQGGQEWQEGAEEQAAAQAAAAAIAGVSGQGQEGGSPGQNLEMLLDLPLELSVELGRTRMSLQELLKLDKGSVIRLGRTEGEPLEIQVNGRTVARGEVVVVNDRLGVRVTEIGEARERIKSLE
ncbi:flagellar motor switch protein FliN [Thiohalorhabdus methylotrophus]|uniref:Flagellar motor switch protein FliN n=1 Tax=Thiohalorhabdus methylotrophus TaxID=3242694 RepID=A0ABV4TY70_9GAMM